MHKSITASSSPGRSVLPSWLWHCSPLPWRGGSVLLRAIRVCVSRLPSHTIHPSQPGNELHFLCFCIFFLYSLSLYHVPKAPAPPVQFPRVGYNGPSWAHFFLRVSVFTGWDANPEDREGFSLELRRTVLPLFLFRLPSNKNKHSLSELRPPTTATNTGLREEKGKQVTEQPRTQDKGLSPPFWLPGAAAAPTRRGAPGPRSAGPRSRSAAAGSLPRPLSHSAPAARPACPGNTELLRAPHLPRVSEEKAKKAFSSQSFLEDGRSSHGSKKAMFLSFAIKMELLSTTF